ncbi:MAG: recombinase family protein [archaeon]
MLKETNKKRQIKNLSEGREGLVYARVSSKRQETEGSGLESQEGRCVKELLATGVPHIMTFSDSYTGSGDFMDRPAMRDMLAYIDAHPHKKFLVIFDDLKRFARDVEFHFKLRRVFIAKDVLLKCLNHNFEDSPEGRFVETVLAGGAELEREQNKRQVIQKMKARMELGYWAFNSRRPYKMINHILIPQYPEAQCLKEALEGFASGRFIRKIDACRFLVEKGYWTGQSPEKYIDKFAEFLRDSFFAGFIEYPKWGVERREGHHEGLINLETFELNQKRSKNEGLGKRIRLDISPDFPLRGLLLCACCNKPLTGAWSRSGTGKKFAYYFCQNKECVYNQKSIRKKDIEDRFDVMLKKQTLKDEVSLVLNEVFDSVWDEEVAVIEDSQFAKGKKKAELEEQLTNFTNLASDFSKSETVRRAYEKQIETISDEIDVLGESSTRKIDLSIPYQTALDKATGLLKSPYSVWQKLEVKEQQGLFYFIFDEKLPYDINSGYQTDKIPTAIRLFEEFATANTSNVEMGGIEPPCIRVS